MLFITHAMTGAALGAAAGHPVAGFVLGVISHHILDWLPHNDPGSFEFKYKRQDKSTLTKEQFVMAFLDVAIGVWLIDYVWFRSFQASAVLWGAIGGVAPDLLDNVPIVKNMFRSLPLGKKYHAMHEQFHHTLPWEKFLVGIGLQILLIVASAAVIIWKVI